MKINRETFLNQLNDVRSGLSAREFIEQSSCFVFQDGYVITFNDEICCRKKIDVPFTGAVPAARLLMVLEKLQDEELEVEENANGELEFVGKRKRFGVTKDTEIFLPFDKVDEPGKWVKLPAVFTEAVGAVAFCVSGDQSRFTLTCIYVTPDFIQACDNIQILRYKAKTPVAEPFLVRGSSLVFLTDKGMDRVSVTKNWIHFTSKGEKNDEDTGLVFSCRKYTEDYPDLDKMMVVKGQEITFPKGLADAAERCAVFAEDRAGGDALVDVTISEGKVRVLGKGISGWYREVKKVAYEGPTLTFVTRPELLVRICKNYTNAIINETKLRAEGELFEYITVLGKKVEEPAEEEAPKEKKKKSTKDES